MSTIPIIPESAPFSSEQRSWLNGFLAGILSRGAAGGTPSVDSNTAEKPRLLVLFGSQSGNAEGYSKKLCKEANARGFRSFDNFRVRILFFCGKLHLMPQAGVRS